MQERYHPSRPYNTSVLRVYAQPGIVLLIKAQSTLPKKARRTALLLLLRTLKRELVFMRGANLYHEDSTALRMIEDCFSSASTYQATSILTEAEKKGHVLRALRTGLGMTQKEFARISGVRRDYISQIERGKHKTRPQTLMRLNELLVSLSILPKSHWDTTSPRNNSSNATQRSIHF